MTEGDRKVYNQLLGVTPPLTKDALLEHLTLAGTMRDAEAQHAIADELILIYLNDDDIRRAVSELSPYAT